jgi:hypothetical protein
MFYLYVNKYVANKQAFVQFFSTLNCQCILFAKKNPIIRIFCIPGRPAVPINPDNWSYTILNIKYVFWIPLQLLSKTVLIPRRD